MAHPYSTPFRSTPYNTVQDCLSCPPLSRTPHQQLPGSICAMRTNVLCSHTLLVKQLAVGECLFSCPVSPAHTVHAAVLSVQTKELQSEILCPGTMMR